VVKTALTGLGDGDVKKFCSMLSAELKADRNSQGQDCEHTPLAAVPAAKKAKVSNPHITGDHATVVVTPQTGRNVTMELTKVDGKWVISKTGINGN
jgi:hypothetical protein